MNAKNMLKEFRLKTPTEVNEVNLTQYQGPVVLRYGAGAKSATLLSKSLPSGERFVLVVNGSKSEPYKAKFINPVLRVSDEAPHTVNGRTYRTNPVESIYIEGRLGEAKP